MSAKSIAFYIKLLLAILTAIHELVDCDDETPPPSEVAVAKQPN